MFTKVMKCKLGIMPLNVFFEKWASVRERNLKLLLETVACIATAETVTCIITVRLVIYIMHCRKPPAFT